MSHPWMFQFLFDISLHNLLLVVWWLVAAVQYQSWRTPENLSLSSQRVLSPHVIKLNFRSDVCYEHPIFKEEYCKVGPDKKDLD